MSRWLAGWRDWSIAFLCITDCWIACLRGFSQKSALLFFDYLSPLCAIYVIPFILLTHFLVDGLRWQLYPFYLQLLFTAMTTIWVDSYDIIIPSSSNSIQYLNNNFSNRRSFAASTTTTTTVNHQPLSTFLSMQQGIVNHNSYTVWLVPIFKFVLTGLSFITCSVFSIPTLPEPEGSWGCGVEEFQFVVSPTDYINSHDKSTFSSFPSQNNTQFSQRVFQSLVFYPIENHHYHHQETCYPWLPQEAPKAISKLLKLPTFLFTYLRRTTTHSMMMAPLSKRRKKYPIVFFSHGLALLPTLHSTLCEGLASQGYVVVVVHHTDGSALYTPLGTNSLSHYFYGSISLNSLSTLIPKDILLQNRINRLGSKQQESLYEKDLPSSGNEADRQLRNDTEALTELIGRTKGFLSNSYTQGKLIPTTASHHHSHDDPCSLHMSSDTASPPPNGSSGSNNQPSASSFSTQELELRHSQLLVRVSEIRAAYDGVVQLSETFGSWIKDRIDWDATAVMGYGFGGAAALLAACSCASDSNPSSSNYHPDTPERPIQAFNSCVLLCPWLDPLKDSELNVINIAMQSQNSVTRATLGGIKSTGSPTVGNYGRIKEEEGCLSGRGAKRKVLPQNFLVVTTSEQCNKRPSSLIRLIKLIKEAPGDRTIMQFSRCLNLDITDVPLISPRVFRWLCLSGPRDPVKSQLMVTRAVYNFLNHQYRRSLFMLPRLDGTRRRPRKSANTGTKIVGNGQGGGFSAGSESDNVTAMFSVGSVSDTSTVSRNPQSNRHNVAIEALKQRYCPSTMQALRLVGLTEHYIRGLGGLRTANVSRELTKITKIPERHDETFFDVMDGVTQFADEIDRKKQKELEEQERFADCCVAEVCHV